MTTRRLIVETADGSRELLFVGRLTVGRAPECDISVNDGKVSRRHAEFDATGDVPRVTDLGSRNGMLVNNRKVTTAELQEGDVIVIGDARVRVEAAADDRTQPGMDVGETRAVNGRSAAGAPRDAAPIHVARTPEPRSSAPPAPAEPKPVAPPEPVAVVHADDERTAVLQRPQAAAAPAAAPVASAAADVAGANVPPAATPMGQAMPQDDRTAVIPRAAMRPPGPAGMAVGAAPSGAARVAPAIDVPEPMPAVPASAQPVADAPEVGAVAPAAPLALPAPRFSWAGVAMLLFVGLASLATLMTAVPLLSSAGQSIDTLGRRQARTLATWLASGVEQDTAGLTTDRLLQAVRSQDGVADAMVLDASTRRIVAPARLANRTLDSLPGAGSDWHRLTEGTVWVTGSFADAAVPVSRGDGRYVAWVRYDVPSSSDRTIALVVAVVGAMVLALLASLLLRRHTASVLGLFTRQVELAVSGADVRVMQGTLLPGLERLPGIVAYLLEQRTAGGTNAAPTTPSKSATPVATGGSLDSEDIAPAWIVVTPALLVTLTSPHAPPAGIRNWASGAKGKHLLDVLEPGPLCNAVVQGLGALSNAAGAAMTVPAEGSLPVTLRREAGAHVRIEMPMR